MIKKKSNTVYIKEACNSAKAADVLKHFFFYF
jgi:hypothetical protein